MLLLQFFARMDQLGQKALELRSGVDQAVQNERFEEAAMLQEQIDKLSEEDDVNMVMNVRRAAARGATCINSVLDCGTQAAGQPRSCPTGGTGWAALRAWEAVSKRSCRAAASMGSVLLAVGGLAPRRLNRKSLVKVW